MPAYADEVLVLRTTPLGEADRIVTLFGRERGKVRAVVKGVRRTNSKFGARLEPGSHVDVQLFSRAVHDRGRLETVTQAVLVRGYAATLSSDYTRFAIAMAMLEVADRLVDAEPAPQQWVLLAGALRDLERGERDAELVLDGYLLRALSLAGWAPTFNACARCGAPGPHTRLSFAAGGAVCEQCAPAVGATIAVSVDVMRVLWALVAGHGPTLATAVGEDIARASEVAIGYANYHLGGGLRAVDSLAQLRHGAAGTLGP